MCRVHDSVQWLLKNQTQNRTFHGEIWNDKSTLMLFTFGLLTLLSPAPTAQGGWIQSPWETERERENVLLYMIRFPLDGHREAGAWSSFLLTALYENHTGLWSDWCLNMWGLFLKEHSVIWEEKLVHDKNPFCWFFGELNPKEESQLQRFWCFEEHFLCFLAGSYWVLRNRYVKGSLQNWKTFPYRSWHHHDQLELLF